MYQHKYYNGLKLAEILQRLSNEGLSAIQCKDAPDFVYPPHRHEDDKVMVFLQGGMKVTLDSETYDCHEGDRLLLPSNVEHSVIVDGDGCTYLWCERLPENR